MGIPLMGCQDPFVRRLRWRKKNSNRWVGGMRIMWVFYAHQNKHTITYELS